MKPGFWLRVNIFAKKALIEKMKAPQLMKRCQNLMR
jgi:hypothetical protein